MNMAKRLGSRSACRQSRMRSAISPGRGRWRSTSRPRRPACSRPASGSRSIGCGSSWHAAKALAALRELGGGGETDAFAASEARLARGYDRVVAISRSGATTEILRALELVRPGTPTVALVGDPTSPVAARCDVVVDLSFADDRSVVQTRFVTTVVCLARAVLGLAPAGLLDDAEAALVRARIPPTPPRSSARCSSGASGGLASPTPRRSPCARPRACGPSPTRRWSTATARSRPPAPGRSCGCSTSRRTGSPARSSATGATVRLGEPRSARRAGPDPAPGAGPGRAPRPRSRPARRTSSGPWSSTWSSREAAVRRAERLDGILARLGQRRLGLGRAS